MVTLIVTPGTLAARGHGLRDITVSEGSRSVGRHLRHSRVGGGTDRDLGAAAAVLWPHRYPGTPPSRPGTTSQRPDWYRTCVGAYGGSLAP
eukprot:2324483-Rhodomonas_salina.1